MSSDPIVIPCDKTKQERNIQNKEVESVPILETREVPPMHP